MVFYDCEVRAVEPFPHSSRPSPFRYIYLTRHEKYQRPDDTTPQAVSRGPSQELPAGSPCSLFEDGPTVLQNDLSRFLPCLIADVEQRNTLIQTIMYRVSERLSRWPESLPTPVVTIYVYKVVKEVLEGTGSVDRATRESRMDYDMVDEVMIIGESRRRHDVVGRVMRESRREYERRDDCSMVPTAKAAQVLKGVMVAGDNGQMCTVCLEDVVGVAGSLPCHHVFHGNCITKWLETSHYCPVCRYELPTDN
ncbi:hypothetical protein Tsubulata_018582 [Turnera subulata]|uniref:RING-type E3 ubiquitin transferase n=1 Tax=Turnera subulata TaxID=218843 RepID=A0A9Q0G659_9ROSI|nr:hypothetical protein Tsubulata_018582 [Turnera subulata]